MNPAKTLFEDFYNPCTLLSNYNSKAQTNLYIQEVPTTERFLILQSLKMIIGYQTSIFKYDEDKGFHTTRIPQIKHLTPKLLSNAINTFIQYSNRLKYVHNKITYFRKSQSVILQPLLNAISQYLQSVVQLYTELTVIVEFQAGKVNRTHTLSLYLAHELQQPITIMSLQQIIINQNDILQIILNLLTRIFQSLKLQTNVALIVLNELWELLDKFQHESLNNAKSQLLLNLLNEPLKRYMEMICDWFCKKSIDDPFQEFFIKQKNSGQFNALASQTPAFISQQSKDIFSFGRFIKVIYCFSNEKESVNTNQFINSKEEFEKIFKQIDLFLLNKKKKQYTLNNFIKKKKSKPFETISSMMKKQKTSTSKIVIDPESLPYDLNVSIPGVFELLPIPSRNDQAKSQIYMQQEKLQQSQQMFLSQFKLIFKIKLSQLLQTIKCKCQQYFNFNQLQPPFGVIPQLIHAHLVCIRKFMLMQQGDTIQELIEVLGEQLERPASVIQETTVSDLIQTALLSSNARLLSPDLLKNIRFKFLSKDSKYSGWEMFHLEYLLPPPLHHLFPVQIMQRYNIIFNFIWKLKRIEYLIRQMWNHDKLSKQSKNYYVFRTALSQFSSSVISDIVLRISSQWQKFVALVLKAQSLDQFIEIHKEFVSSLEGITFMTAKDRQIHLRLENITQIILKMRELQIDEQKIDIRDRQREIIKLSEEFKMRMKDLIHSQQAFTVQMLDLPGFYQQ